LLIPLPQHIIPIPGRRPKAEPLASDLLSERPKPFGIGIALRVGVGCANELRIGAGDKIAQSLGRLRRPASASAEIKRTVTTTFNGRQAHRIDGSFGDTEAVGSGLAEAKQGFGPA